MTMTIEETLSLYDAEMRRDPFDLFGQVEKLPGLTRVVTKPPSRHGGWILYTHLDAETVETAIETQIADLGRRAEGFDEGFEWKVFDHDTPADLKLRLIAHGFAPEEPEALMALDLKDAPARLWEPPRADIRRISDPAQVTQITLVQAEVWDDPMPGLADELAQTLRTHPELLSIFQAYADEQPIANGWIRYHPGRQFADLWGGSTRPAYRGRGLYTALVAVRAQEARTRGVRFLTVDASPMSRPILEKLGFRCLTYSTPFVWKAR
jgi:GNAT superfamily N-acetyltransferase